MKIVATIVILLLAVIIALIPQIVLLVLNARAGCYPWSPREVEYHDHMTLCPGQRAVVGRIVIPRHDIMVPEKDGGI